MKAPYAFVMLNLTAVMQVQNDKEDSETDSEWQRRFWNRFRM